ncbi:purine-binding chemotaxis protein CheW [Natrinema hispanicum]|uniref:Purine-binding chemotaxis protein CheW n=1 Tax=Natrinema hispanicum TaxID=392421 RepID=A0A482Y6Z3_9EURY|nr:chemotaxis protein CheW [Natrinema hispanicum]RZV08081.1 purine-binding chemotaxis protein CheW [Natrinema hispanicum]
MGPAPNHDGATADDKRVTVLTFDLEDRRYCVSAESVASVLGIADDSALADADDPWNAGAITVAGERVRVVDLPRVFGASFRTMARVDAPKLLVFDATDDTGRYYGWLIDDVGTTSDVRPAALEPPQVNTTHIKGRLEIEGREVVWLNEQTMHG